MNSRNWIGLTLLLSTASMTACGGDDENMDTPDAAPADAGGPGADAAMDPDAMMALPDLSAPESVVWDAANDVWYVSNISGDPAEADGVGWITRLDPQGQVMDAHWVERLNAPKGMAIHDGQLYVADLTELVVIDIASGAIDERLQVTDAQFLNDVAVGSDGTIYVTDTLANTIYSYDPTSGDDPVTFLQDASLKNPNGILAEDTRLVVGSIGAFGDDADLAPLWAIDLASKEITQIGTLEGKLDGLIFDGNRYIVSDFRGAIHTVQLADGAAIQARDTIAEDGLQSAADIGFDPDRGIVAVPDLLGDQVILVSVDFDAPESALWDADKNVWYVSNVGGADPAEADGEGWISRLDAEGQVLEARWVDGLNAPKGMALIGTTLYVTDIDRIVPIDISADGSGTLGTAVPVAGAQFLNDMAADAGGTIYVTDTLANAIYEYTPGGGDPAEYLQDDSLKGPNGILVEDTRLVVGSIGSVTDFDVVAPVWSIALSDQAITQIGTLEGKFDGLVALDTPGAWIISDFRGDLFGLDEQGGVTPFFNVLNEKNMLSAADIGYDPVANKLAIPDLLGNAVVIIEPSIAGS